ncbi:MAG: hypothetical protein A2Y12_13515 [Planctomycetes bacterium GWF2_42_9]|nr:MAG: hypothetical protein A2Y12_13515 [Planctomycetes bacterium GWF2_42_9]
MNKFLVSLYLALLLLFTTGSSYANEWYAATGITGQDNSWYNSLNWSLGHVPVSTETVEWRYATSNAHYSPLVINGGTAESGSSTCGSWAAGTASFTVTNGSTYNITGSLSLHNGAADAAHSPANIIFNVNGGSTVNVSGDSQLGRIIAAANGQYGQCTINIDGSGTTFNQGSGSLMYLGWGVGFTEPTRLNVSNGAIVNFLTTGGLRIQPDNNNVSINLSGGSINIKGNRTPEVNTWINSNWLIAYDGAGLISVYYDAAADITRISGLMDPVVTGNAVTGFRDDFDSYPPDNMFCGDPVAMGTVPVGLYWRNIGVGTYGAILDCTIYGTNNSNSMSVSRPISASTVDLFAYPKPLMFHAKGFIYRFEHDLYVPTNGQIRTSIFCDNKRLGYYIDSSGTFKISDSVTAAIYTGKPVPYNQWVHIRMELHEDNKVWMWYTPEGGSEKLIIGNLPWSVGYGAANAGVPVRSNIYGVAVGTPAVYFDNYKVQIIDKTPQGYPAVSPATSAITVNGSIDLNTEWAGAKKVAYKPIGSKGNFNPIMASGYWQGLTDATKVDVYMTYDTEYFYIAVDGNNITSDQSPVTSNGRVDTVFTWDFNDVSPTVSYVYRLWSAGADSTGYLSSLGTWKSIGYAGETATDYNDFTLQGGQMGYTVNNGRIQAEFKIPFTFMPEFTGVAPGMKLNVQFNYMEKSSTQYAGTTNSIGCFIPDRFYGSTRLVPVSQGITFPIAGDFNSDCMVDFEDLSTFVQYWLVNNSIADFDNDGKTNFGDFAEFGLNWMIPGQCN